MVQRTPEGSVHTGALTIGKVAEILQVVGSRAARDGRADSVVLHCFNVIGVAAPYKLPRLLPAEWAMVAADVSVYLLCSEGADPNRCLRLGCAMRCKRTAQLCRKSLWCHST